MESETTKYEYSPIQLELLRMEINNITGYIYIKIILQCISLKEKSKNGIWDYKVFIDFHVNKMATLYITVRMFKLYLPV
jgi:hypothetical protein